MDTVNKKPTLDTQETVTSSHSFPILCCHCGTSFSVSTTGTNICLPCLGKQVDITTGITKEGILEYCKHCDRYQRPPWIHAEPESRALMDICLKKIKGLKNVKLLDANFIWTEPESKLIRIKLTIQKEAMNSVSIKQSFTVQLKIEHVQCDDCRKEFTHHTWRAQVQVRQRVNHKKTFLYLEQLMVKQNLDTKMHSIEMAPEGIDFNFSDRAHALKLIEFMTALIPIKLKTSSKHLSTNEQSNTSQYKYIFSVEIPSVCQDDLVIFTPRLAGMFGGCSKVLICTKVASIIHFIDLNSMRTIEMSGNQYFQHENEIQVLAAKGNLSEFMVVDIEHLEPKNLNVSSIGNKLPLKASRVTVGRTSDWTNFDAKTHIGDSLQEGTTVLGYDLTNMNLTGLFEEAAQSGGMPDVVIVKRTYPELENKKRMWKLKRLEKEGENFQNKGDLEEDSDEDSEQFLAEIEADPELRSQILSLEDEKTGNESDAGKNDINVIGKDNESAPKRLSKKRAQAAEKKKQDAEDEKQAKVDLSGEKESKIEDLLNDLDLKEKETESKKV